MRNLHHHTFFAISLALCLLSAARLAVAQARPAQFSKSVHKDFRVREDSLKTLCDSLVNAEDPAVRLRSDSQFIRTLVRTLKTTSSFYYPFDSLLSISRLYAPDSTFRIFTWQYKRDDLVYLQEGAIQMATPDGSLKLYPLFDVSMFTSKPLDSVRTRRNWIGAVYYRIIEKTYEGRNYYTLLGFDDFSNTSNKKWLEVLTFRGNGDPAFGGPYISFRDDSIHRSVQYRFNIEYKKEAATRFNYDPQMDLILFDHLVPEGDEPNRKDSYIPDGDFEGFKWQEGQWVHVEKKIFDYKLKDGQFPQEQKMLDENGNADEQKLQQQSEKNIQQSKTKPKPAAKKTASP